MSRVKTIQSLLDLGFDLSVIMLIVMIVNMFTVPVGFPWNSLQRAKYVKIILVAPIILAWLRRRAA